MSKNLYLSLSLFSVGILSACGGGGGGGGAPVALAPLPIAAQPATPSDTPSAGGDSGSVSAQFVRGERSRYQLFGVGSQSFGRLDQSEQAPSGAMVRLNDNTLTGAAVTKDINGDENFAIGRWAAGTVTTRSGAETLTGTDNRAYHYVALNTLEALPMSGSPACDAGVFTSPTYVGGGLSTANVGSASGSATLAFGGDGATVKGAISVSAGGVSGTVEFNSKVTSPTTTPISGMLLSGGPGAAITLGSQGTNAYAVAVGYSATLSTGARYSGVAKFRCS